MKFTDLNLEPELLSSIQKLGFVDPTPIQQKVIPYITEGKDVAGLAQTGTGKTAAFVMPLIDRILKGRKKIESEMSEEQEAELKKRSFFDWKESNFILILVPTRELALQVFEHLKAIAQDSNIKGCTIYGGTGYEEQKQALRSGVEFVIATPGRLIDLYKEHILDLKQVRAIVFDEADRMFDMGFKPDMKFILQRVPRERQFMVFSATLNFDVLNVAYQFGAEPVEFDVSRDQAKAENVKDYIFHVGHGEKPSHLLALLKKYHPSQAIVFSNFKENVDRIAWFLQQNKIPAVGISSLLTQAQRERVMTQFREGQKSILVATDVAARGLDIKDVDLIVNYELPNDAENYVHRIGRTGRAGAEGIALSMVCDRDVDALQRIEEYLKNKIEQSWIEDTELVKDMVPFPEYDFRVHRSKASHFERQDGQRRTFDKRRGGRDGGRDRHDRHDRQERNDRHDRQDRQDNRDRKEVKETRASGNTGDLRKTSPLQVSHKGSHHRDRVTGRHGQQNSQSQNQSQNQNRKQKSHRHRDESKSARRNDYKPQTRDQQKKQDGIGQKVSKFIKNLFGKSEEKEKKDKK